MPLRGWEGWTPCESPLRMERELPRGNLHPAHSEARTKAFSLLLVQRGDCPELGSCGGGVPSQSGGHCAGWAPWGRPPCLHIPSWWEPGHSSRCGFLFQPLRQRVAAGRALVVTQGLPVSGPPRAASGQALRETTQPSAAWASGSCLWQREPPYPMPGGPTEATWA